MKKISLLLCLLFVAYFPALALYDFDFSENNEDGICIYYKLYSDKEVAVAEGVSSNAYYGNVVIPSTATYEGVTYPVTAIHYEAFKDCEFLTSVKIPNSVNEIGNRAFLGCSRLNTVEISGTLTSIGPYAFSGCSSLTSIDIPDSLIYIGSYAFSGCYSLTSIEIHESITNIGEHAFDNCSGLESVTILNKDPDNIKLGKNHFILPIIVPFMFQRAVRNFMSLQKCGRISILLKR